MPELSLTDSIITSLNAQEPWPDNVKLFQPYEVEQILLPDNASCLAVQAFLKICNLPFEVEMRWNAEFMSPSGRVPFIKCGAFVVSELEPVVQFAANKGVSLCSRLSTEEKAEMRAYMSLITNVLVNAEPLLSCAFVVSELEPVVQFAANKGVSLCSRLSTEEKAEMRAYMSLITNVLVNAELYISWLDDETFNAVTKVRNSSVYPWPLGWLQTRAKRSAVAKRLKALNWHDKTLEQVLSDVEQCCNSLSQRLGDRDYFFGTPTPLDALVYGHVRAILSANGPKAALMIKPITSSLLRHLLRMVNLTGMKLSYQEEYLITQAFKITRRRSPDRCASDRSTRGKRSKMSLKSCSKDNLFGFKPFASKQIIIMTSKEGHLTCQYDGPKRLEDYLLREDQYDFIFDIVDEVIDKVIEVTNEERDFEIIVYPTEQYDEAYANISRTNDYLDTIVEDDLDETLSASPVPQVINDVDSDGLVNDKLLGSEVVMDEDLQSSSVSPDATNSSNPKCTDGTVDTVSSSEHRDSVGYENSVKLDLRSVASSESTLKLSSVDVSVESLLNYLKKKSDNYNFKPAVADID